jgi:hypothetical protein
MLINTAVTALRSTESLQGEYLRGRPSGRHEGQDFFRPAPPTEREYVLAPRNQEVIYLIHNEVTDRESARQTLSIT